MTSIGFDWGRLRLVPKLRGPNRDGEEPVDHKGFDYFRPYHRVGRKEEQSVPRCENEMLQCGSAICLSPRFLTFIADQGAPSLSEEAGMVAQLQVNDQR